MCGLLRANIWKEMRALAPTGEGDATQEEQMEADAPKVGANYQPLDD